MSFVSPDALRDSLRAVWTGVRAVALVDAAGAPLTELQDATFSDLKALLGLTQGNLGVHLQKLEQEGYVAVRKEFVDKKPRTTARLTAKGRKAFLAHVKKLDEIARDAE